MDVLPCDDGLRWCWSCQASYKDNLGEDNPEARCPSCSTSQAYCEGCGEAGGEQCVGCERVLCRGCWPRHRKGEAYCGNGGPAPEADTFNAADVEKMLVSEALKASGTTRHAARLLGITRYTLARRIAKYRITWPLGEPNR